MYTELCGYDGMYGILKAGVNQAWLTSGEGTLSAINLAGRRISLIFWYIFNILLLFSDGGLVPFGQKWGGIGPRPPLGTNSASK